MAQNICPGGIHLGTNDAVADNRDELFQHERDHTDRKQEVSEARQPWFAIGIGAANGRIHDHGPGYLRRLLEEIAPGIVHQRRRDDARDPEHGKE
jgi:hypothetical protein